MPVHVEQLALVPAEDPTGNGQPTREVVLQLDSGPVGTGIYFFQHGGNLLRAERGNPSPSDAAKTVFELDGDGKLSFA